MSKIKLKSTFKKMLSDTLTPVSIYLKLRDKFQNPLLLESSDYHGRDNSYSYICCDPIAAFEVKGGFFKESLPGNVNRQGEVKGGRVIKQLDEFVASFEPDQSDHKFVTNGLFGYIGYDSVQYFEDIKVTENHKDEYEIPDILYHVYRYVIIVDHFKNELFIFEHAPEGDEKGVEELVNLINNKNYPSYHYTSKGAEKSNYEDDYFKSLIKKGIDHCHSGDVFQMVLSRRFEQGFKGDELEVTAIDEIGQIMAVSHKMYDVKGVQFHPESIMTEHGHQLLKNWIEG
jgi:anthranilate synthase component 1